MRDLEDEARRVTAAYRRLDERVAAETDFFGHRGADHVYRLQERYLQTLRLLKTHGYHPLDGLRILDVGCGDGVMLRELLQWGAAPTNLAGIELRPEQVARAKDLCPHLDVRCGSARELPWPAGSFDLACQHTVFSSVLDARWRRQIADELLRVLRPGGAVLWYDFVVNNPANPDVRGIPMAEVRALFPSCTAYLERVTLAPPLARLLPARLFAVLYPVLAAAPPLRTHCLGLLVKG